MHKVNGNKSPKINSILSELLADFPNKKEEDFATIYGGVSSCLVADYSEFQDKIFYQEIDIKQGESLLLCSDGLTDGLSDEMREKIWLKYADDKDRLTVCRKMIEKQSFSDDLSVILLSPLGEFLKAETEVFFYFWILSYLLNQRR